MHIVSYKITICCFFSLLGASFFCYHRPPLKGGYYIKVMALGVFRTTFSSVGSFMFTQNNLRVNGAFRINSLIELSVGWTGDKG